MNKDWKLLKSFLLGRVEGWRGKEEGQRKYKKLRCFLPIHILELLLFNEEQSFYDWKNILMFGWGSERDFRGGDDSLLPLTSNPSKGKQTNRSILRAFLFIFWLKMRAQRGAQRAGEANLEFSQRCEKKKGIMKAQATDVRYWWVELLAFFFALFRMPSRWQ